MPDAILININKTHKLPPIEVPRLAISKKYFHLAFCYQDSGNQDMSNGLGRLSAVLNGLKALRFIIKIGALSWASMRKVFRVERWGVIADDVVRAFACLWNVYWGFQQPRNLDVIVDCGRLAYQICVGGNETCTQSYGDGYKEVCSCLKSCTSEARVSGRFLLKIQIIPSTPPHHLLDLIMRNFSLSESSFSFARNVWNMMYFVCKFLPSPQAYEQMMTKRLNELLVDQYDLASVFQWSSSYIYCKAHNL